MPKKSQQSPELQKLGDIDDKLGTHTKELEKQTAKLGKIEASLKAAGGKLSEQTAKLSSIDAQVGEQNDKLATAGAMLGEHTHKLGSIDGRLAAAGTILGEQAEKLGSIDSQLGEQTGKLGSIDGRLAAAGTILGEQAEKLGSIDSQFGEQTGKLGSIDGRLGEQTEKLGSIDGRLGEQTGKLGDIESKLGSLEAGLARPATLSLNAQGNGVGALQGKLAQLGVPIPQHELDAVQFGLGTQSAVLKIQEVFSLPRTGMLDAATSAALERAVTGAEAKQRVDGRVFFQDGRPAAGVTLRLYKRDFGGGATNVKEFTSDAAGFYTLEHDEAEQNLNLEVRAVDPDNGEEHPLARTKHRAGRLEVMNLLVPTSLRRLEPEYERLSNEVGTQIGGIANLKDAQEADGQRDLTLLRRSTGWDARLLGLAATAAKLSPSTGLDQGVLYALFRAGLPTDHEQLARVGSVAVEKALGKAAETGIVALDEQQIAQAKSAFEGFARTARRELKLAGTASTFGEFLQGSGLAGDTEKNAFEDVYFARRSNNGDFWSTVGNKLKDAGLDQDAVDEKVKGLRLQGKLGYLSLNSSGLTEALKSDITEPDQMDELVELGLYDKDAWKEKLWTTAEADTARLEQMIPPAYAGEDLDTRLDGYAADLARKTRLSFPTQVVSRMIETNQMTLGSEHAAMKAPVCGFLGNAQKLGFSLGRSSVEAFVREHKDALFDSGTSDDDVARVVKTVKNVQCIYQVTPTNEAMEILLHFGFTSALDVLSLSYDSFLRRLGPYFPSLDQARLVYRRAEQVAAVTHSVFTAAKQLDSSPGVHALSPPASAREAAKTELLKRFPTMETLFGSLDYCECEHCRSVLSPAAYLVDLLQFLEPEDLAWQSFLTDWEARHNEHQYMPGWRRPDGSTPPPLQRKPYHALIERRPDLPHLPLTCENTHTALPYIDVVNEILEYHVANGRLQAGAAHDTGSATSEELLAEPQNILPKAYEELDQARYPLAWSSLDTPSEARLGLPFDLWIETVRRFLEYFEVDLSDVLEAFRTNDALFHADGDPYGHASVFVESLGLSPAELGLFGATDPLADWHTLYGFEDEDLALNGVQKDGLDLPAGAIDRFDHYSAPPVRFAKALSRHLGVTYKDVIELVQTSFVNPKLDSLVFLRKLGIDVREVFRYKEHAGYPPLSPEEKTAFETRVLALSTEHGEAVFGDQDALAWLNASWDQGDFDDVLLLADPSAGCDFDAAIVRYSDGRNAEPLDYLKINLFARLWRKLGWTIEEVDHALRVFLPSDLLPLIGANLGAALKTALVYFAALEKLGGRIASGNDWRRRFLSFWSELSTTGKKPLYAELFLTASVLKDDKEKVFDNPLGRYLQFDTDDEPLLKDHLLTIQAALGLTADEVSRILQDAKRDMLLRRFAAGELTSEEVQTRLTEDPPALETEALSLGSVSLLYRYGLLARSVKLSVAELITLKVLSGLDPFAPPQTGELADIENNHPLEQTLRLVDIAEALQKASLSSEELDYLLRHRFDPVGKHRSDEEDLRSLIGNLAAGLQRIDQEHSLPADEESPTDEFLRTRLALLFEPAATNAILGTLAGTVSYPAEPRPNVGAEDKLSSVELAAERRIKVSYDSDSEVQKLWYQGILTDSEKARLEQAHSSVLFAELLDSVQGAGTAQARALIEEQLGQLLAPSDVDSLLADAATADGRLLPAQRAVLAEKILPVIREQLSRQLVAQTLATALKAELSLVEALLTDVQLVSDPGDSTKPLIGPYLEARQPNLPDQDLEAIRCAHVVLVKLLQVAADLGLTEREIRHCLTHRSEFGGFDAAKLPTEPIPETAATQFHSVFGLVEYTLLKQRLGGTDDLITVFEQARRHFPADTAPGTARPLVFDDACRTLATVTRRDVAWVRSVASHLGYLADAEEVDDGLDVTVAGFTSVTGLVRIWACLEICEKLGVSPSSVAGWTGITDSAKAAEDRFAIAQDVKHTIKARFDSDGWQRIAGSIFDKLRQRQRDALVAFTMHENGFERVEQLFEYFLVDPGMEPVVQTSRIQLAIASIQLFIQRSLLNLEENVHPSAINAKHWQWMKRYRVWEANRKIWLFPENWLEPEFRDDKTHLFRELEGALLQEDVSDERAEDAFFAYLKKLEALARLEIVAMYCEEKPLDPSSNTLHVIGRTYNAPHNYFYRRYAHQMWTPWEPVEAEIEGDHVAAVMWRGRLHLFWITFLEKADESTNQNQTPREMADKKTSELKPRREVQVRLNWSEYAHGEWSTRETSGLGAITAKVGKAFDAKSVFVHVSTEYSNDGSEAAVWIHLSSPIGRAFRVVSKNSAPESRKSGAAPGLPYLDTSPAISVHSGKGGLKVEYADRIVTEDGGTQQKSTPEVEILQKGGTYSLLAPGNDIELPTKEIGALITPFFYQDNRHTFFVEPTFNEVTIEQWEEWVIPVPASDPIPESDWWWEVIPMDPYIPSPPEHIWPWLTSRPKDPGWTDPVPDFFDTLDPGTILEAVPRKDWVTDPGTVLQFGSSLLGKEGSLDPKTLDEIALANREEALLSVDAGGDLSLSHSDGDAGLPAEVGTALRHLGASPHGEAVAVDGNLAGTVNVAGTALNLITNSGLNPGALANMVSGSALGRGALNKPTGGHGPF